MRSLRLDIPLPKGTSELEAMVLLQQCLEALPEDPLAIALSQQLRVAQHIPEDPPPRQAPAAEPGVGSVAPAWQSGMPYQIILPVPGRSEKPSMTPSQVLTVLKRAVALREKALLDPVIYVVKHRGGADTAFASEDDFKNACRNAKWQRDVCHELLPLFEGAGFDLLPD